MVIGTIFTFVEISPRVAEVYCTGRERGMPQSIIFSPPPPNSAAASDIPDIPGNRHSWLYCIILQKREERGEKMLQFSPSPGHNIFPLLHRKNAAPPTSFMRKNGRKLSRGGGSKKRNQFWERKRTACIFECKKILFRHLFFVCARLRKGLKMLRWKKTTPSFMHHSVFPIHNIEVFFDRDKVDFSFLDTKLILS